MISVNGARREIARRITPAIRRALSQELAALYDGARRDAELALFDQGEADAACTLPAACPYAFDELLGEEWWPVNRHGLRES